MVSYIATKQGFLYLAVVLDLFSRKVIGWNIETHMRTQLCLKALNRALDLRAPNTGLIHHSDRGSQVASSAYQKRLAEVGARPSMSRRGNCWDNAVV